ncbi:MAG: nucleotidyl transferase AbiEii/AbiGii toxin family protein [Bacteroidales bacterium]|nr:nucleotidyl transferase AbiEii/AbiGii toxin family protein [Bacteroidales bacterium]
MSIWQNYSKRERIVMLQQTALREHLPQTAIEKDWWVTVVLKALFMTEAAPAMLFKGGTSLSKGWHLIERLSEDVDLAIDHGFFGVNGTNKSQRDKLRKKARAYIVEKLSVQLDEKMKELGVHDYRVESVTTKEDGTVIDSDKDPTNILVWYEPVCEEQIGYIPPRVKVEITCLSMSEPSEVKEIRSLISNYYQGEDNGSASSIKTVVPTRTFLEKAFLLNEEFQKDRPRHVRMSRHLYDLHQLMDTKYGYEALKDTGLYEEIVKHREAYYSLKYVDYERHAPERIDFVPPASQRENWSRDYDNMLLSFIYGEAPDFTTLLKRMEELRERFRNIHADN